MIFKTQDITSFKCEHEVIRRHSLEVCGVEVNVVLPAMLITDSSAVIKYVGGNYNTYKHKYYLNLFHPVKGIVKCSATEVVRLNGEFTFQRRTLEIKTIVTSISKKISIEDLKLLMLEYHINRYNDLNNIKTLKNRDECYTSNLVACTHPHYIKRTVRNVSRLRKADPGQVFNSRIIL